MIYFRGQWYSLGEYTTLVDPQYTLDLANERVSDDVWYVDKEYRECGSKVRHLTWISAFNVVMRLTEEDGMANLHVYQCKQCTHYHFGRMDKSRMPNMKKVQSRKIYNISQFWQNG